MTTPSTPPATSTATPLLPWEGSRGFASIARLEGEVMDVHATAASAPGSRPTLTLPSGQVVRMKVHRCRAVATGTVAPPPDPSLAYFLEGRLIDASRVVRAEIEALLGGAPV